jgi:hypothetical protein
MAGFTYVGAIETLQIAQICVIKAQRVLSNLVGFRCKQKDIINVS